MEMKSIVIIPGDYVGNGAKITAKLNDIKQILQDWDPGPAA